MKKFRIMVLVLCLCTLLTVVGCGDKSLPSATIVRDDARTGGSLSFVYNQHTREIHIGGKNEVVQYSLADESKDLEAGCRIGLKVIAPNEELDVSSATLEMNGVNYSSKDFLESVNDKRQRFFEIQPMVSKEDKEIKFTITWQDGTAKQEYKIIIVEGTKFMKENGTVE